MNSTQQLVSLSEQLAASGKTVTVKVLPRRNMRKGEGLSRDQQHGKGSARGNLGGQDSMTGAGAAVGSGFHCRPINSLGGRPVDSKDLKRIQQRAAAVYARQRRDAVLNG